MRHSSEHGLGSDGAEGEAGELKEQFLTSTPTMSSYYEQKSCYVPSVPFVLLVPSSF